MDAFVDDRNIALAVDLDGTLINGDLLWETLFILLRQNPFIVLALPFWLARGKAYFKHQVFSRVTPAPQMLNYRGQVVEFLRAEHHAGRRLVLATASAQNHAEAIAAHLGFFDQVVGSDATRNLRAGAKRDWLVAHYGDAGFDYIGNSADDIAIFDAARHSHVVAPDRAARAWASRNGIDPMVSQSKARLRDYIEMLRVHQWAKNTLIAVPAILDHRIYDVQTLVLIAGAFFAFSFLASAVYVFNDLFDLGMDRAHPTKCKRPLAAGRISPAKGLATAFGLVAASAVITLFLPTAFAAVLVGYFVITTAYSLKLKRWLLIDVLVLAGLYTVRVIAGMAVAGTEPSFWLLAFSTFFFLSLALVKRFVELDQATIAENERLSGRGYRPEDKEVIAQAGMASAFSSVVVLALYLQSDAIYALYNHPWMIWPLCPLVLYIIMRVWILAKRREFYDDPVVFITTDWRSQIMIGLGALLMICAGLFDRFGGLLQNAGV